MSSIRITSSLTNRTLGLALSSGVTRTSNEEGYSVDSISVTSEVQVALGDFTTLRDILILNQSGDDLKVGFATGVYPIRLNPLEAQPIRFDVEGLVETQTIVVTAEDANTTLHEQFFSLEGNSGTWGVWFDIGGAGSDPTAAAYTSVLEITDIAAAATAATVGAAIYAQMIASTAFAADFTVAYAAATDTITITDKHTGTRTNIADGSATTGFSFANTQEGAASPTVYIESVGTSQVIIAVAPA